jgi:hypothetical protein
MFVVLLCVYIWLALLISADYYFGVQYITVTGTACSFLVVACYYGVVKFAAGFNIQINRKVKGGSVGSGGAVVTPTAVNARFNATTVRNSDAGQEATIQDETAQNRSNITYISQRNIKAKPPPLFKRGDDIKIWWKRFSSFAQSADCSYTDFKDLLQTYMDDESMRTVHHMTDPSHYYLLDTLRDRLFELFVNESSDQAKLLQRFYKRQQKVGEVVVDYGTALCDLAEPAIETRGARYDKAIRDQFLSGLRNREIQRWVKNERHPTFREALSAAMKYEREVNDESSIEDSGCDGSYLTSSMRGRRDSGRRSMSPNPANRKNVNFDETAGQETQGIDLQQREFSRESALKQCWNCKQYGHVSRECRANANNSISGNSTFVSGDQSLLRNPQNGSSYSTPNRFPGDNTSSFYTPKGQTPFGQATTPQQPNLSYFNNQQPKTSNSVSVVARPDVVELLGWCYLNGILSMFQLDSGSEVTLISEELWKLIRPSGDVIRPLNFDVFGCNKSKLSILGCASCHFKVRGFECIAEVLIAKSLSRPFIVGMDTISKWPVLKGLVDNIRVVIGSSSDYERGGSIAVNSVTIETKPEQSSAVSESNDSAIEDFVKLEFDDLIATGLDTLTQTTSCEHEIKLSNDAPVHQAIRRVPYPMKAEFRGIIDEMLKNGLIVPSSSPWCSPTVLVKKKDGSLRVCVDFRRLNDQTIKDRYPIPKIDDMLATLRHGRVFSSIDLASGYHQIKLRESDQAKTAFGTEYGLFMYTVMPFGLCNAPATFQRMMERVLSGLTGECCAVYFDDVLIYSRNIEEHKVHVSLVLKRLREANLKIQWKKCKWGVAEVEYLGHVVGGGVVKPRPEKLKLLHEMPVPTRAEKLAKFVGLAGYYRKFIRNFAKIAAPLYAVKENNKKLEWTSECQLSFEFIRSCLTGYAGLSANGILALPDFEKPFRIETDACDDGMGAVLAQKDANGDYRPVSFWSKRFVGAERRYSTSEKELMAVVRAIEHFKQFVYGAHFDIITDHQPLKWLYALDNPAPKLARWQTVLREYDFTITHRKGSLSGNADALSRWYVDDPVISDEDEVTKEDTDPGVVVNNVVIADKTVDAEVADEEELITGDVTISEVNEEQLQREDVVPGGESVKVAERPLNLDMDEEQRRDDDIRELYCWIRFNKKRPETSQGLSDELRIYWVQFSNLRVVGKCVFRELIDDNEGVVLQYLVPKHYRPTVLFNSHDSVSAGHLGYDKTFGKIKARYYWPAYTRLVREYVEKCAECTMNKTPSSYNKAPLIPIRATRPLDLVTADIIGPLVRTHAGNKYILVVVDHFSKLVDLFAMPDAVARTVAEKLVKFICVYGVPERILTDQGKNFQSALLYWLWELLDVFQLRTTPYHPECDGQTERFNRTLEGMLRAFVSEHHDDWDEFLELLAFAYKTAIHKTTGVTPFEVIFGRKPKLPAELFDSMSQQPIDLDPLTYASELRDRLYNIYRVVRENGDVNVAKFKFYHDRRIRSQQYEIGDFVKKLNFDNRTGLNKKLKPKFTGPYVVVDKIGDVDYAIKLANKSSRKQVVHVSLLRRCVFTQDERLSSQRRLETNVTAGLDFDVNLSAVPLSLIPVMNEEVIMGDDVEIAIGSRSDGDESYVESVLNPVGIVVSADRNDDDSVGYEWDDEIGSAEVGSGDESSDGEDEEEEQFVPNPYFQRIMERSEPDDHGDEMGRPRRVVRAPVRLGFLPTKMITAIKVRGIPRIPNFD